MAEKKNIWTELWHLQIFKSISQIIAIGGIAWALAFFIFTTKTTNASVPQIEDSMKKHVDSDQAFQQSVLIKIEGLTVSLNYLAKETQRKNDLEEKYHEKRTR